MGELEISKLRDGSERTVCEEGKLVTGSGYLWKKES